MNLENLCYNVIFDNYLNFLLLPDKLISNKVLTDRLIPYLQKYIIERKHQLIEVHADNTYTLTAEQSTKFSHINNFICSQLTQDEYQCLKKCNLSFLKFHIEQDQENFKFPVSYKLVCYKTIYNYQIHNLIKFKHQIKKFFQQLDLLKMQYLDIQEIEIFKQVYHLTYEKYFEKLNQLTFNDNDFFIRYICNPTLSLNLHADFDFDFKM